MNYKKLTFRKLILIFLAMTLSFIFAGCHQETVTVSSQPFLVVDRTTDQALETATLNLYFINDSHDLYYVNIEEFCDLLEPTINTFSITKTDTLNLKLINQLYTKFNPDIEINIDSKNNTIAYTDFNIGAYINDYAISNNSSDLEINANYANVSPYPKTINLTNYDMKIYQKDNTYYMPLQAADLLIAGENLYTYVSSDKLYVTDNFSNTDYLVPDKSNFPGDEQSLIKNTVNFMGLLFDNFYGLRNLNEGESYLDVFKEEGFFNSTTIEELDSKIETFIIGLDDLHTNIIDYGYKDYDINSITPSSGSKILNFYTAISENSCQLKNTDVSLTSYNDYYVLEINRFNPNINDKLSNLLVDIDKDLPVYIDVSCNPGGNILGVFNLISYMTNNGIVFRSENIDNNNLFSYTFNSVSSRALQNEFRIFTSNVTFSAANLFVSLVKDNNLGLIFGQETSGGSASPRYVVFPNNLILLYSSNFMSLDKSDNIIESGITPDIEVNSNLIIDAIAELENHTTE